MKKSLNNQRGQGLVEYLIIVAIMAVGAMGMIRLLGNTTSAKFAQITTSLQGGQSGSVKFEKVDKKHYKKKDMSDFFQGSRSKR